MKRYTVGIDLGTSNTVVAYVEAGSDAIRVFDVEQLVGPGAVAAQPLLPSVRYHPAAGELPPDTLRLPWAAHAKAITAGAAPAVIGRYARTLGAQVPGRLVTSAKSWLSHASVDRLAAILPWGAADGVDKVSPVDASASYLAHVRDAWDARFPDAPLAKQDVILTVPASFDDGARALTVEAAKRAKLPALRLLEEPQAAFYDWLYGQRDTLRESFAAARRVLICDVGGGTTDLTLVDVAPGGDGEPTFTRVGVGNHLMLGGDNMDLALAHVVARKLAQQGTQADPWQLRALTYACRSAKEQLLSDAGLEAVPLVVPSRGSKLIGGSIRTELTRAELTATILEGFFPRVDAAARPVVRTRAGLTQLGLPYAQDAGVTRHLAAFLGRQVAALAEVEGFGAPAEGTSFLHPTAVLFNGGVFKSSLLAGRVLEIINGWLSAEGAAPARLLGGADLDLAVARGAAYYGYVKRGKGVRIRGGTARAYYVAIESAMPAVPGLEPPISALCVAPFGMEEGSDAALPPQEFGLVVGEPVQFRFFGSSVRRQDQVGTMLDFWSPEELQELESIQATLPSAGRTVGEVVAVRLHARVTEAGTLELEAVPSGSDERWKVEFDVRGGAGEGAGQGASF